jgi:L-lactate dehydrogenase
MGRELTEVDRNRIDTAVRRAAYAMIQGKGATWFGVGAGLARIAEAIQRDERALITFSTSTPECQGLRARRGSVSAACARRERRH